MSRPIFDLVIQLKNRCLSKEKEIMDEYGLTLAEYNGLSSLSSEDRITGQHFSEKMGLSASRGSRVVQMLNQKGYIATDEDPENRRRTLISLTQEGMTMKGEVNARILQCEDTILENLKPDEQKQLRSLLETLVKAMK